MVEGGDYLLAEKHFLLKMFRISFGMLESLKWRVILMKIPKNDLNDSTAHSIPQNMECTNYKIVFAQV